MNRLGKGAIFGSAIALSMAAGGAAYASGAHAHAAAAKKALKTVNVGSKYAFKAQKVTISAGTKVTWTNVSSAPHTVTSIKGDPKSFDKNLNVNGKTSVTFTKKGTYHYFCKIHPYMKATIVVK